MERFEVPLRHVLYVIFCMCYVCIFSLCHVQVLVCLVPSFKVKDPTDVWKTLVKKSRLKGGSPLGVRDGHVYHGHVMRRRLRIKKAIVMSRNSVLLHYPP